MKLDSKGKRIGLIMVLSGIILLIVLFLVSLIMDYQDVSLFSSIGQPAEKIRGSANALLHEWIGLCLLIFPLVGCGIMFMPGYGKNMINWIKYGPRGDDDREQKF